MLHLRPPDDADVTRADGSCFAREGRGSSSPLSRRRWGSGPEPVSADGGLVRDDQLPRASSWATGVVFGWLPRTAGDPGLCDIAPIPRRTGT